MRVLNKIIIDFNCDQCNTTQRAEDPDFYTDSEREYGDTIITIYSEVECPNCGKRHCIEIH